MKQLARDVAVNVLANLIAALVIYLVGAAIGAFPTYWLLIVVITTGLVQGLVMVGIFIIYTRFLPRRWFMMAILVIVAAVSVVLVRELITFAVREVDDYRAAITISAVVTTISLAPLLRRFERSRGGR